MAEPVRVRQLSDQEGQKLQRLVRRGTGSTVRLRRAMVVLASAGGNSVPVIARLVQADEDSVRGLIHCFDTMGMPSLDPRWEGGRPRQISPDDKQFIVSTATCQRISKTDLLGSRKIDLMVVGQTLSASGVR